MGGGGAARGVVIYLICSDFCILAKHQKTKTGLFAETHVIDIFPELAGQVIPKIVRTLSPTVMSAVDFGKGVRGGGRGGGGGI